MISKRLALPQEQPFYYFQINQVQTAFFYKQKYPDFAFCFKQISS